MVVRGEIASLPIHNPARRGASHENRLHWPSARSKSASFVQQLRIEFLVEVLVDFDLAQGQSNGFLSHDSLRIRIA